LGKFGDNVLEPVLQRHLRPVLYIAVSTIFQSVGLCVYTIGLLFWKSHL